jgi:CheY-like chemotaxis protein
MSATRALDILVVDDDDGDSLIIQEALAAGAVPPVIHRVSDGRDAIEYLHRRAPYVGAERPDLVLLDLNMPGMDGREVLAQIKADEDLKAIPVVVLTTTTAVVDITASYVDHANAFVTKPLDIAAFEAVVQHIDRFYREVAVLPHHDANL